MNRRVVLLAAVFVIAWSCLGAPSVSAQCKPGDLLVGEDEDNYYCRSRREYQGSAAEKAAERFCSLKRTLAADQNAIRQLGFTGDVQQFEMFGEVAKDQKAELQKKVYDALLDSALDGVGIAADSAKSLNPWNVNNAVRMLEEKGFRNKTMVTALRRIAAAKDKPAMAAAYNQFVEITRAAREGWSTGSDMATDPVNAELRLALGALKLMQGNPQLGLVITTAEFGENLAYLYYVNGRVTDLTKSTDDKLERLGSLTKRLKDHVAAVQTSRADWRRGLGLRAGEPRCE